MFMQQLAARRCVCVGSCHYITQKIGQMVEIVQFYKSAVFVCQKWGKKFSHTFQHDTPKIPTFWKP